MHMFHGEMFSVAGEVERFWTREDGVRMVTLRCLRIVFDVPLASLTVEVV